MRWNIFNVNNHLAEDAIKRLLGQYAEADKLQGLISAFVKPLQQLEFVFNDLNVLRQLAVATGVQLDGIGQIVGLPRPAGDDDDTYRQKLYAQIKINTSQGQPEMLIQMYQLFTGANLVLLTEHFPAEVTVSSEYMPADQDEVNLLVSLLQRAAPAGVRVDGIIVFDPTEAFAYDGGLPGLGYGDANDSNVGGKYATILTTFYPFAYAGSSVQSKGYGAVQDPLAGGGYVGV